MNEIVLTLFTNYIVPGLGTAILGFITYGSGLLISKLKNDQVKQALEQLTKITQSVVKSLNQTLVPMLKEKASDGKLSKEDIQAIKDKAINMIKAQIQNDVLDVLARNTIDVNQRISTEIESQVYESKLFGCIE
jgi:hypothetical protein